MAKIDNKKVRELIRKKYNNHCAYCGCVLIDKNFTIDHIEPLFRKYTKSELDGFNRQRGTNEIDNFNPCCASCNSSKSTFTIEKWRHEIGEKFERALNYNSNIRLLNRFGMIKVKKEVKFYFEKQ